MYNIPRCFEIVAQSGGTGKQDSAFRGGYLLNAVLAGTSDYVPAAGEATPFTITQQNTNPTLTSDPAALLVAMLQNVA
jgi:hypothetical protein